MKTYGNVILMTVICIVIFWVFMALRPAAASWQLIPGKPYDGHSPISILKELCWSAASSKCALEKNRSQYINDRRKAPQK